MGAVLFIILVIAIIVIACKHEKDVKSKFSIPSKAKKMRLYDKPDSAFGHKSENNNLNLYDIKAFTMIGEYSLEAMHVTQRN